ncbi:MAG TPA: AMP-binding protein [Nitrososphaerales archaeon]|nr:AMP-binding protein [Nitrososphaerales archaeon]
MPKVSQDPLTPINFLHRSSRLFPDKIAVEDVDSGITLDYSQFAQRVASIANFLRGRGTKGDRVAFLSMNSTALLEAHFAVPLAERVLVAINYRLLPKEILFIIRHSGARMLFFDSRLSREVTEILPKLQQIHSFKLFQIGVSTEGDAKDDGGYEDLVRDNAGKQDLWKFRLPSEKALIALDYTSGTTGVPKGVMYSHRGAYLNALADIMHGRLDEDSVYLWALPMFHCNGWCFSWATTGAGAKNVIISRVEAERIWKLIEDKAITHLCAAPTVLVNLSTVPDIFKRNLELKKKLTIFTGGAPPAPKVIENIETLGAEVVHLYGLTETYGPNTLCLWKSEWNGLPNERRSAIKARQGVQHMNVRETLVVNEKMKEVVHDGKTIGEVVMRGNTVMLGYYKDPKATREAFKGGMFHSGDLAVVHEDGYIELVDRKKDLIISGGEKISSIEVESILYRHPQVLEAAVIAVPDEVWGEVPKAFITLREGMTASEGALSEFCRENLAHFKCPKYFEFGPLPKTSTGKVMKFSLREKEWANQGKRIH